jgi:hypothetical protein
MLAKIEELNTEAEKAGDVGEVEQAMALMEQANLMKFEMKKAAAQHYRVDDDGSGLPVGYRKSPKCAAVSTLGQPRTATPRLPAAPPCSLPTGQSYWERPI